MDASGAHADAVQVLTGFAANGQDLIEAAPVKVAFTGSVASGRAVAATCATTLTPAMLELGGKDVAIAAADLDAAAGHVARGALQTPDMGASASRTLMSWTRSMTSSSRR